ncbi:hypothetical protein PRZ48_004024 [Zasmidium cellare]|uniref:Knr4/Smi1-like domain-containing protein n=1 Tax=Zasmidium cellare TaxID=395010 RepID=A0ABR0EWP5_ZASCE|nr:hypothetical protein PRZ48_004024 [Zasmidium cellare]
MSSTTNLPIRSGRDSQLSQERKSGIENALQKYRSRVLELNLHALEIAIQDIEQQDLSPEERLSEVFDGYGIRLDPEDPTITAPRDFLSEDRRENLIRTNRLDGTTHGDVDLAGRNAWIENTERKIAAAERVADEVRPEGLPADLKYLMTLVRGLCGPGLPQYRFYGELNQLKFLSSLDDADEDDEDERKTDSGWVALPNTSEEVRSGQAKDGIFEDWGEGDTTWRVAVAVCVGDGGFAVYCKDNDGDDEKNCWRYGLSDPKDVFMSELYDTIEEFLEFYAEFNKQSEEDDNILV